MKTTLLHFRAVFTYTLSFFKYWHDQIMIITPGSAILEFWGKNKNKTKKQKQNKKNKKILKFSWKKEKYRLTSVTEKLTSSIACYTVVSSQ